MSDRHSVQDDPKDLALDALEYAAQLSGGDDARAELEEAQAVDRAFYESVLAAVPVPPRPELRQMLLDAVSSSSPSQGLTERLAELFDLPPAEAAGLLRSLPDSAAWEELMPGVRSLSVQGGERLLGAELSIVRVEPGASIGHHAHGGEERVFLLSGSLEPSNRAALHVGDLLVMGRGTEHSLRAAPGGVCFCAAVVFGGLQFSR